MADGKEMSKGMTKKLRKIYDNQEKIRAKGAEAPPLAKSKLREQIKYRIVLIFFCVSVI